MKVKLYTDGGVRTGRVGGSKGRGSAGFVILDDDDVLIRRGGLPLDEVTVNEAEYSAMILGLYNARMLGATEVDVYSDSMLMVTQINGLAECRMAHLQEYLAEVKEELKHFDQVKFTWIPREENKDADYETRRVLDSE